MPTVYTFGDSVLDCGHYNPYGLHPGGLLVANDDERFPEFRGRDLRSRGPARLEHRARDGATVDDLPSQLRGLVVDEPAVALLTIGGNDLLSGLLLDRGPGIARFAERLEAVVRALPIRPLLVGNVYDPSLGDDARNFLPVDAGTARRAHGLLNDALAGVAARHATLVDLHAHFLRGDPSWFSSTIEPSLIGASEIRRSFLEALPA